MITKIIIGVALGYFILAYYPLLLRFLPYLLPLFLIGMAFFALRALPLLAEPLSYGLLIALVCYCLYIFFRNRDQMHKIINNLKQNKVKLPIVNIEKHRQISVLLTLIIYTLGLTFVTYLFILLIYVQ